MKTWHSISKGSGLEALWTYNNKVSVKRLIIFT